MHLLTVLMVASALTLASPALAGKKNKSNGNGNQPTSVENFLAKAAVGGLITFAERAIIGDYLDRNRSAFAGAQPLPPGIARKVERGGALPPGIAKKTLPTGLLVRLPARPGQEWRVVGTDLLIVEVATNVIVDVFWQATVQDRHLIVTDGAKHPPNPRRNPDADTIVDDYIVIVGNS